MPSGAFNGLAAPIVAVVFPGLHFTEVSPLFSDGNHDLLVGLSGDPGGHKDQRADQLHNGETPWLVLRMLGEPQALDLDEVSPRQALDWLWEQQERLSGNQADV